MMDRHVVPLEEYLAANASGKDRVWPEPNPIKVALPIVERLRADMLPEALKEFVFDVAERQQSPADFVAVTAIIVCATVIGNRVRIAPKQHDDWTVVPNLWGAIVGRPSAMKSPAMQSALSALYSLQDEAIKAWEAECSEADVEQTMADLGKKNSAKEAAKLFKMGDREAARAILSDSANVDAEKHPCPRYVVNDASVEKLGELLNENPRGLLLVRDELPGFLARMESEEFQSERAFFLKSFNGDGRFTYDRIGRGTVHIPNCTLSLVGGVQPSRIAPLVIGALNGSSNDGLIQRLQMVVWPDDAAEWKYVDRHSFKEAREAYTQALAALDANLPGTPAEPAILRFSPAAQVRFVEFMTSIQTEARRGELSSVMESHILKMPKTVASLALIFELLDGGRFEVGEIALQRALMWLEYLRSHASRLYAAGNTSVEEGAKLILSRRSQLPPEFTHRDISRKCWAGLTDRDTIEGAVETLVETFHIREADTAAHGPGRPSGPVYAWNPHLGNRVES
ncbi:MAG: YfjI family protein [Mesorhizobium sp.]